jgi:hypothetical protein
MHCKTDVQNDLLIAMFSDVKHQSSVNYFSPAPHSLFKTWKDPASFKDARNRTKVQPPTRHTPLNDGQIKSILLSEGVLFSAKSTPTFSTLFPTTSFPHVTLVLGTPKIDRSIYNALLTSKIRSAKSRIAEQHHPVPKKFSKPMILEFSRLIDRSLLAELSKLKAAKSPKKPISTKPKSPSQPKKPKKTDPIPGRTISFVTAETKDDHSPEQTNNTASTSTTLVSQSLVHSTIDLRSVEQSAHSSIIPTLTLSEIKRSVRLGGLLASSTSSETPMFRTCICEYFRELLKSDKVEITVNKPGMNLLITSTTIMDPTLICSAPSPTHEIDCPTCSQPRIPIPAVLLACERMIQPSMPGSRPFMCNATKIAWNVYPREDYVAFAWPDMSDVQFAAIPIRIKSFLSDHINDVLKSELFF